MKQLFFNFLLQTVSCFTKFKKQVVAIPGTLEYRQLSSSDCFDFTGYLAWQKERSEANRDNNFDFIKHFVTTQAFCSFIERVCIRQDQSYTETTPE